MILLTGASGFIGKDLLESLIEKYGGENILALTTNPLKECNFLLHNNYSFNNDIFLKNNYGNIHTLIHAGAFTPKNSNQINLVDASQSNIVNTHKLLQSTLPNLNKIIYLSTIDVYDNTENLSENSLEKPSSLYGFSKLYCEKMIENWGLQNNIDIQILRIGHVYGPGEDLYQKVIPNIINKVLNDEPIQIWGKGNEIRSFIFVKDVVKAILKSVDLESNIGIVNLVSNNSITIEEIVNKIVGISQKDIKIEYLHQNYIGRNYLFDNNKMIKWLLEKETNLEIGLKEEYDYFKNSKHRK